MEQTISTGEQIVSRLLRLSNGVVREAIAPRTSLAGTPNGFLKTISKLKIVNFHLYFNVEGGSATLPNSPPAQ